MKKEFVNPGIKISHFTLTNIITTSGDPNPNPTPQDTTAWGMATTELSNAGVSVDKVIKLTW